MSQSANASGKSGKDSRSRRGGRPCGGGGNAVFGLGLIGAMIYYIQHADGFWWVVLAILKSLVWPVFVVYDLLKHLGS